MNRARRPTGIVVTILVALAAIVSLARGVSWSPGSSEHDTLRSRVLAIEEAVATPVERDADPRARTSKRGAPNPPVAHPLVGFVALTAALTLLVRALASRNSGRDPIRARWLPGAIWNRAPPLVATA